MIPRNSELHGGLQFQQPAAPLQRDMIRLGPLTVTATTSGTAQTLFTVDTDSQLLLGKFEIDNNTAGNITIFFMIDSTIFYELAVGNNSSGSYDFGELPIYDGEAVKVYASATGTVVTGTAERRNS